ncbi:hypothetical protein GCM10027592_45670 [Spirosoma flavus]
MDVRIAQPLGYSELGSRSNNEDNLFPHPTNVSKDQKWFIVCDGVGGMERGEVASLLAVTSVDAYLRHHPVAVATDEFIQQVVGYAETQFNQYLSDHEEAAGMATTLTLVYFHEAGATVAHIGDSRVYHIRDGQVIWRTSDHSYVNELLKAGVISPAEAQNHPQRNVITRALQGGERSVEASVQIINDLRPGDYFFMCTDGILERISDELLVGTLYPRDQSNEHKLNTLRQYSLGNTRDNFTAYLLQIEHTSGSIDPAYQVSPPVYEQHEPESDADQSVTLINVPIPQDPAPRPVETADVPRSLRQQQGLRQENSHQPAPRRKNNLLVPLLAVIGTLVGAGGYWAWQQYGTNKVDEPAKMITQSLPISRPASASTSTPTDIPDDNELTDLTVPASESKKRDQPTSSEESSPKEKDSKKESDRTTVKVEVVKRVDDQLSVVRDTKTKQMGLQKQNGKLVGELIYSSIGPFENGVASVNLDGKSGFLSRDGRWFDEIGESQNGKMPVRKGDRWGYLNTQGQLSINLRYEQAKPFQADGTAEVIENGKTIRIDKQGHTKASSN